MPLDLPARLAMIMLRPMGLWNVKAQLVESVGRVGNYGLGYSNYLLGKDQECFHTAYRDQSEHS